MEQLNKTSFCYIIYSKKLDRFYVGSTILEAEQRLELHLKKYYGNLKFTAKSDDWYLYLKTECNSIDEARYLEKHIKKMKSRKYIGNLRKYPEIITKLKERFKNFER